MRVEAARAQSAGLARVSRGPGLSASHHEVRRAIPGGEIALSSLFMPGKKTSPGQYRGLWLRVRRTATTRRKRKLDIDTALLAVGDADRGWVPVLVGGLLDHVRSSDVERIQPAPAKPSRTQQAARKRLVRGVKVTQKEADKLRGQWRR